MGARVQGELAARTSFGRRCRFWSHNQFSLCSWYLVFGFIAFLVLVFGILVSQSSITLLWYSSLIHCFNQKRDNAMLEIAWIGPAAEKGLKTIEKKIRILTILYFNMVCVIAQTLPMAKRTQALSSLTRFEYLVWQLLQKLKGQWVSEWLTGKTMVGHGSKKLYKPEPITCKI